MRDSTGQTSQKESLSLFLLGFASNGYIVCELNGTIYLFQGAFIFSTNWTCDDSTLQLN